MRPKSFIVTSALLLVTAAGLYAFQQPTVTIVPATPSTIYVNSTSTVTITAQIPDSLVIPNGVNLVQTNPSTGAASVVGLLSANGQTFTITFHPVTTAPVLFSYQVSAAFKGLLRRSLSLPITVAVAPPGVVLPPDPGPVGMQTLAGIDSDHDGVRDDVERWIAVTFYTSAKMRAGATQYVQALQLLITGATDTQTVLSNLSSEIAAEECLNYIDFTLNGGMFSQSQAAYAKVLAQQLNTYARAQVYYADDQQLSGQFVGGPTGGQYSQQCTFNVASLPN